MGGPGESGPRHGVFGKSFGNDITEGKISLPVIFALQRLSEKEKNHLTKILSLHTKKKKLINDAMKIIKKSGAVKDSLKYAENLIDKAWQDIEPYLPRDREKEVEDFKAITYSLVKRNK